MNKEKRIAVAVIIAVSLLLIGGNAFVLYLGSETWPGQTTDTWTGSAPQQK